LNISETVQDRHIYNAILIETYKCPDQQCNFAWFWLEYAKWAKFSTTRTYARPFCDNWAFCKSKFWHGSLYGISPRQAFKWDWSCVPGIRTFFLDISPSDIFPRTFYPPGHFPLPFYMV